MSRLFRNILVLVAAAVMGLAPLAQAEVPMVQTQVPGYYRTLLGQFEITALYDGSIDVTSNLLKNASSTELHRLMARMFVDSKNINMSFNAFLVNTGSHLVLVDTGTAKLFGPSLGFAIENMKASGYDPAQVDTILITHLHGDHVGGLLDASGQRVFPKATIFVPQVDSAHWLSQKVADGAPKEIQYLFKIARDCAAPYMATGQWKTFTEGSELVPGIRAVKAYGHTPGHTVYAVESEGQKLMIWGDLMHVPAVQFARPGVSTEWESDQKQAIASRRSIMKAVAASKSLVAGMHLPFPGIGHIRADGKDSYSWVPIAYRPVSKANK
jgi:glyoxylase-like metal-dependent hydrolase (beta-lactamase superfamily II)